MPVRQPTTERRRLTAFSPAALPVLLLWALPAAAFHPPAVAPATAAPTIPDRSGAALASRLSAWSRGAGFLDDGHNAEAADLFARQLRAGAGGLEAADGFCQASSRLCRSDSAAVDLARIGRGGAATGPGWAAYLEGTRARRVYRFADAAEMFARAAELSLQDGDTASTAAALLAAAQCHLREEDRAGVETACARIDALLAGRPAARRLHGEVQLLRAGLRNQEGRLGIADTLYGDVLALAQTHGWRQPRCDALNGLGVALSKRRRTDEALARYRAALSEARRLGDPYRLVLVLTNLAYEETQERELSQASAHLEAARRTAESCDLEALLGLVANGLGAVADTRGDRVEAAALFRRSCDHHVRTGNARAELGARQRLAYDLLQMGEYREAAVHYARCLEILREKPNPHIMNWVLAGMAATQHYLGNLDLAERYYREALKVNERLGDRRSEALCLNSIGLLHALRGDYRQALLQHDQARAIGEAIGDEEGVGDADASIAEVLYHLGDYESAREHGERAVAIAARRGAEELLRSASSVMALVYDAAERPDLAEAHHRRALAIARRWHDNLATIWALDEWAAGCLATGRRQEARALLDEAAALLAPRGEYPARARTLLLLSRIADDPSRAGELAGQALAAAREGCLPEAEWQSLSDLGQYALARGDTGQAERNLRGALAVIESLRRDVGVDELRRYMLLPALEPYERLVDLLLAHSQADSAVASALVVAERARAQLLAARLRAAQAHTTGTAALADTGDGKELLSRLAHAQARLQDGALTAAERCDLRTRVAALEERFRLDQLRGAGITTADARYPAIESADSLLAALQPGERLLSWFLGARASYLFSAAAGGVRAYALPPRAEIEARLLLFLQMQRGETVTNLPPDAIAEGARQLYGLLLGPAADDLRSAHTLVLVPDGLLHRLPFALLRDEQGPLIEAHELFVAPSLRTLRELRARARTRARAVQPPRLTMLAIGCEGGAPAAAPGDGVSDTARVPADAAMSLHRVLPFTGAPIPRLPEAAAEAAETAALFPGALVLTGDVADEASFKHAPLAEARIVHVAAHGIADASDVRRSLLVLNPTEKAGRTGAGNEAAPIEDGVLQWHEAVALPLRASLVTLSSCRSAGGVLVRGEGVTGLTQAFLHAGATCVLAAQSDVPDRFARRLMRDFYHELRAGRTAAAALRQAQLRAMRRQDVDQDATAWAGFVLTGDGSVAIDFPERTRPAWLPTGLAALTLAGLVAEVVRRRRRR